MPRLTFTRDVTGRLDGSSDSTDMIDITTLLNLRPAAGHFDGLLVRSQRLWGHGWMFQPGQVLEGIDAYLDGMLAGQVSLVSRPDLEQLLAWATDARPAGFNVELPLGGDAPTRLDLLGYGGNAPPVRLSCLVPVAADDALPAPPKELALRVAKLHGPVFRAQGLKMFTDLTDQMARLGISPAGRLLDWGCGCLLYTSPSPRD